MPFFIVIVLTMLCLVSDDIQRYSDATAEDGNGIYLLETSLLFTRSGRLTMVIWGVMMFLFFFSFTETWV